MTKKFAKFKRNPPKHLRLGVFFWVECVDITQNPFNERVVAKHIVFKPGVIAPMPLNHVVLEGMVGSELMFTEDTDIVERENVEAAKLLLERQGQWKKKVAEKLSFALKDNVDDINDVEFVNAFSEQTFLSSPLSCEDDFILVNKMLVDPLYED